ncbi:hypothetical protein EMIHUDRAFT_230047 [Emiliania huxleyi CCMP1516]|uniref:Uncharacterized protein n=2 Tax=Emiliania huxleyi TaxID=2903 RepID=A0A0D3KBC1_EMIH1|nr:hypothetical protein EMIHUDRAFT_230047 [Emiliania huxleyi CCMP1516]EOD33056.1 hypothetical protein EMIHUDRAFT_230047 [Emiliania huxleyi CCMP1516]|eukprot:XP_005785485.1 hypothetical protein EMIHUDRAFT_230047 [Emiliania huxleyi CCMP1516]
MHRVVCEMRRHSHHLRNLGTIPEITVDGDSGDVCGESDENYAADAPRPTPSGGSEDACAPVVADSADGGPARVLVLGERGVGGSALVEALRTIAAAEGIDLPIERHVDDHLRADGQGAAIVIHALAEAHPFIAVSVEKQTNVALLWGMVRAALAAPPSPPPPSIDGSGAPLPGKLCAPLAEDSMLSFTLRTETASLHLSRGR